MEHKTIMAIVWFLYAIVAAIICYKNDKGYIALWGGLICSQIWATS